MVGYYAEKIGETGGEEKNIEKVAALNCC